MRNPPRVTPISIPGKQFLVLVQFKMRVRLSNEPSRAERNQNHGIAPNFPLSESQWSLVNGT